MFNFCLKARVILVTIMKWCISEQRIQAFDQVFKIRTVQPVAGTMQKINSVNLCHRRLPIYIYFLLFEENHQNWISKTGEKISPTISLFLRKMIA